MHTLKRSLLLTLLSPLSRITNTGSLSGEILPIVTLDLGGNTVNLTGTASNNDMSFFTSGQNSRGYFFTISYALNEANMIGLTVIPEPRAMALMAAVCALAVAFLRRRR